MTGTSALRPGIGFSEYICGMLSLRELYNLHGKMVYNLALGYVQNTSEAEEITQDVFLKVHERIADFRGESSEKTWIYRIAVNTSLDYLKRRQAAKRSLWKRVTGEKTCEPAHYDHPGIQLEHKEAYDALFAAINQLPLQQKTVLVLLKIEGLSQTETAEIMELSIKAVESLFQRAKGNLAKILNETKE